MQREGGAHSVKVTPSLTLMLATGKQSCSLLITTPTNGSMRGNVQAIKFVSNKIVEVAATLRGIGTIQVGANVHS